MKLSTTGSTAIDEYDYKLPKELIAQHPLAHREDARLLVVDRQSQSLHHTHMRDIDHWLRAGDGLVINESKVLMARLVGRRVKTGGRWQGLFLDADPQGTWRILCKTRGRLQPGETIMLQDREGADCCTLTMIARLQDGAWAVRLSRDGGVNKILDDLGRVPLPHYIRGGNMTDADGEDYQTVYARNPGSIAAPTAGLHFTPALLKQVQNVGVKTLPVTLHVGAGTFRPITTESIENHQMHAEYGQIQTETAASVNAIRASLGRIIAVGTTSVRLLETASQSGRCEPWEGWTQLYIHPPYDFKVVDGMLTNFHVPRSTLLVLARTFGGDALLRRAYQEAISQRYRFFSYGDAMLIL